LRNTATNVLIPAAVAYNAGSHIATLNPNANLAFGTQYTVTLTGGPAALRDLAVPSNPMITTSWSFTTNAQPTVTARTPAANQVGVARGANITATFSEVVTGVSGATVTLTRVVGGVTVGGAVTLTGGTLATFNPTANLLPLTQYRVTLTGGPAAIRDVGSGNAPLTTVTWTFRTGVAI
jgi:hypothetical protein